MAEAAVEDRPQQRFYCHICMVQFENASANFTCPHCSGGFIEELEVNGDNPEDSLDYDNDDEEMLNYGVELSDFFVAPSIAFADGERRSSRSRGSQDQPPRGTSRRYASVHPRRNRPLRARVGTSNLRQHTPFENLMQEVILNLGVGVNWPTGGNMQLFLGNPGDYAWGREGLDAIVTQLLNQMDGTGPPPLSKDVIDALPVVEVSQQQVDVKLQCSVCWEDFMLKESVRQLPCQHIYHESCIRPWLELHGTCPICRQNLAPGDGESSNQTQHEDRSTFNALQQLFWSTGNRSNSPSSSTATRGSDSPSSSNSSSSNRDPRM